MAKNTGKVREFCQSKKVGTLISGIIPNGLSVVLNKSKCIAYANHFTMVFTALENFQLAKYD